MCVCVSWKRYWNWETIDNIAIQMIEQWQTVKWYGLHVWRGRWIAADFCCRCTISIVHIFANVVEWFGIVLFSLLRRTQQSKHKHTHTHNAKIVGHGNGRLFFSFVQHICFFFPFHQKLFVQRTTVNAICFVVLLSAIFSTVCFRFFFILCRNDHFLFLCVFTIFALVLKFLCSCFVALTQKPARVLQYKNSSLWCRPISCLMWKPRHSFFLLPKEIGKSTRNFYAKWLSSFFSSAVPFSHIFPGVYMI